MRNKSVLMSFAAAILFSCSNFATRNEVDTFKLELEKEKLFRVDVPDSLIAVSAFYDSAKAIFKNHPTAKLSLDSFAKQLGYQSEGNSISSFVKSTNSFIFSDIHNTVSTSEAANKTQEFVNESLPISFTSRIFLNNAVLSYQISQIPGHIAIMNSDSSIELVSLVSFTNKVPAQVELRDEIIYDNRMSSSSSFNGSFLIGNATIEKDKMLEIIIQDVAACVVPDTLIKKTRLYETIKQYKTTNSNVKAFFVKGALLTTVTSKKFNKEKYSAGVTASWITASGEAFREANFLRKERLISLDLISIDNLLAGLSIHGN
jgi:hypothetical protein